MHCAILLLIGVSGWVISGSTATRAAVLRDDAECSRVIAAIDERDQREIGYAAQAIIDAFYEADRLATSRGQPRLMAKVTDAQILDYLSLVTLRCRRAPSALLRSAAFAVYYDLSQTSSAP